MSSPSSIASSSGRQSPKKAAPPKAKRAPPPEPPSPTKAKHLDVRNSYKFKGKMKQYKAQQELSALEQGSLKETNEETPSSDNATVPSSPTKPAKSEILDQEAGGKASGPPRLRARPSLAAFQASTNPIEPPLPPRKLRSSPLKPDASFTSNPDPPPDSYPSTPTTPAPPAAPEATTVPSESTLPADIPLYDPYTNCTKQPSLTKSDCLTDLSCAATVTSAAIPACSDTYHIPVSVQELDHAKNLVLDLLGWGVAPEFLVDEGVSAQLIYRVFTDLNLRLPTNLRAPP
ncbi:hypothetical protein BKA70DRAFT_1326183 [Coprinopsis sp. MPI-PUGE-AT-0042]|nr:hypothetical protein BKA70DRAFT_1326183 [Coprinopsis sp. MPI-PUGE-AT-0042]